MRFQLSAPVIVEEYSRALQCSLNRTKDQSTAISRHLFQRTCGRGLAGKEYHLFHDFLSLLRFHVLYQQVPLSGRFRNINTPFSQTSDTYMNNPKNVEGLAFIFVKTLDLNIKHGIRVNLDA